MHFLSIFANKLQHINNSSSTHMLSTHTYRHALSRSCSPGLGEGLNDWRCWLRCLLSLPALLISYFETWHFHTLANLKAYKMVANTRTSCYRHPCSSCCSCCCCCCLISWRMCFVATAGGTLVVVAVALLHAETHERRILFAHMQQGSAAQLLLDNVSLNCRLTPR